MLQTPPPSLCANDPPSVKSQPCKGMGKDETFSAKKRLTFEDDNLNEDLLVTETSGATKASVDGMDKASLDGTEKSGAASNDLTPQKKPSRGDQSPLQQSG